MRYCRRRDLFEFFVLFILLTSLFSLYLLQLSGIFPLELRHTKDERPCRGGCIQKELSTDHVFQKHEYPWSSRNDSDWRNKTKVLNGENSSGSGKTRK